MCQLSFYVRYELGLIILSSKKEARYKIGRYLGKKGMGNCFLNRINLFLNEMEVTGCYHLIFYDFVMAYIFFYFNYIFFI